MYSHMANVYWQIDINMVEKQVPKLEKKNRKNVTISEHNSATKPTIITAINTNKTTKSHIFLSCFL